MPWAQATTSLRPAQRCERGDDASNNTSTTGASTGASAASSSGEPTSVGTITGASATGRTKPAACIVEPAQTGPPTARPRHIRAATVQVHCDDSDGGELTCPGGGASGNINQGAAEVGTSTRRSAGRFDAEPRREILLGSSVAPAGPRAAILLPGACAAG
ncbi:hypothetical protein SAMN02745121_02432 [Nannocystis exedens]|uniref:Uncharacterized protein n=1 Tax=Nannocystis exedens TaxID=54 RepID=A0A1I1WJT1_9BACT|nr:hypothetical protein [Nannocystis exedens]PCC67796.1 hypothetical protein NAEX_00804 [Nannocystis exedens]SFD95407.1 hypothetical protein SAMN02745121_02432 [Nannocystis exedens]